MGIYTNRIIRKIHTEWWQSVAGKTPIVVYQAKGAASYAASKVNLANAGTNDAIEGTAPTWNSTDGWIFDGSTQYLLTENFTNSNNLTIITRFSGIDEGTYYYNGSTVLGTLWQMPHREIFIAFDISDGTGYGGAISIGSKFIYPSNLPISGILGVNKNGLYENGEFLGALSQVPETFSHTFQLSVGAAIYANYSINNFWYGKVQCICIYSETLSSTEMATISAAMAAI